MNDHTARGSSLKDARNSLWRHHTEALAASPALCEENPPVTGEASSQRANNADVQHNKLLNKVSRCRWFEIKSRPTLEIPSYFFQILWKCHELWLSKCSNAKGLLQSRINIMVIYIEFGIWSLYLCLSHITPLGPVRAVPGLFWTKIARPFTGPRAVRRRTNFASTYGARRVLMHAL